MACAREAGDEYAQVSSISERGKIKKWPWETQKAGKSQLRGGAVRTFKISLFLSVCSLYCRRKGGHCSRASARAW